MIRILKFSGTNIVKINLKFIQKSSTLKEIHVSHHSFCCKLKEQPKKKLKCYPNESTISSCSKLVKLPHLSRLLLAIAIILFIISFSHWNYVYRWEKDETQRLLMLNFSTSLFFIGISKVLLVANSRLNKSVINDDYRIISSSICKASNVFYIAGYISSLLINILLGLYSVSLPTGLFRTQTDLKKKFKIIIVVIWFLSAASFVAVLTGQNGFETYFSEIDALCSPLNILLNSRNRAFTFSLVLLPFTSILCSLVSLAFASLSLSWRFWNIHKSKKSLRLKAKTFKDSEDVYNLWTDAVFDAKSDDVELVSSFVTVCFLHAAIMFIYGICGTE